jgi:hypothetical protein
VIDDTSGVCSSPLQTIKLLRANEKQARKLKKACKASQGDPQGEQQQQSALYPSPATTLPPTPLKKKMMMMKRQSSPNIFISCRQKTRFSVGLFAVVSLSSICLLPHL